MKTIILKHALNNALGFNGKVNKNVVLGLVLREDPKLKKDVPKVLKGIENIMPEVERLSLNQIKEKLKEIAPELLHQKKKKRSKAL